MAIQSFACSDTEVLFRQGVCHRRWQGIERVAPRKLDMLDAAAILSDLKAPPSNKLERLERDRKGQWAIRVNDQWRICFRWGSQGPEGVEIVDYH